MATNTSTNPNPESNLQTGGIDPSALLAEVVKKQMGSSGFVSSATSELDSTLQKAISGYQNSADSANKAVSSSFNRQINDVRDQANVDQVEGRAAGSGGLLNIGALRELTKTTDKNLNDLEQRKQELILQNDAQAASKIADLQFQAVQFRQQATQQIFSNLLGIANLGIQTQQEQRMAKAQTFQESQAISNVALQYGLNVGPGETIDSITTKAMPFASQEQKAKLAKMQSEIRVNNAQAAKYVSEGISDANFNLDAAIKAAQTNPAVLGTIKDTNRLTAVINGVEESNKNNVTSQIQSNIDSGQYKTKAAAIKDITASASNGGTMNPAYLQTAIDYINKNYKEPTLQERIKNQPTLNNSVDWNKIFGDINAFVDNAQKLKSK